MTKRDVIEINVGGCIFTALESTLVSQGGMLATMLTSEAWAASVLRDNGGRVFLNFDPDNFRAMLQDIQLGRQQSLAEAHWGACGVQSSAYFAFLDFLGLLPAMEPENDALKGYAQCKSRNGFEDVGQFISTTPLEARVHTWGVKIWSGFRDQKFTTVERANRHNLLVAVPFFGVAINVNDGILRCSTWEGNGLQRISEIGNHEIVGWSNRDLSRLEGASMHLLQEGDLIYMQVDPGAGLLRMRSHRFGVLVFEKQVPPLQSYRVLIGLDNNMCAELTTVDWYKRW